MSDQQPEGEFDFIAQRLRPLAREEGALHLSDDAALLAPTPGHELVITADTLVAGTHFRDSDPIDLVAQKALLVNLSDLAAKGAVPRCYFLQIVWPRDLSAQARCQFVDGLVAVQERYGISVMGGDTTSARGPLTVSVTMIGQVPTGSMIPRNGAAPGDDLWVTGMIGDAALALSNENEAFQQRYLLPDPPVLFGTGLGELATAALDVSDGLVADAGHLAAQSGCAIEIEADLIPVSDAARPLLTQGTWQTILTGGDDYQILFSAPPDKAHEIAYLAEETSTMVTRIGTISKGEAAVKVLLNGEELKLRTGGYTHF